MKNLPSEKSVCLRPAKAGSNPRFSHTKDSKNGTWYLLCLTLSIIRYWSGVKWSNLGKRVVPSLTPWCSSYQKESLQVAFNYGHQLYLYIYIYVNCEAYSSFKRVSSNLIIIPANIWLSVHRYKTQTVNASQYYLSSHQYWYEKLLYGNGKKQFDTIQVTSETYTLNVVYVNFVTTRIEATAKCIPTKPRAKCSVPSQQDGYYTRVLFWTNPGSNPQQNSNSIQVRWTAHVGQYWRSKDEVISDTLLWTLTHECARVGQPAKA